MADSLHLYCIRVNSAAGDRYAPWRALLNGSNPGVRLVLLGRNHLIWRDLQNDPGLKASFPAWKVNTATVRCEDVTYQHCP